jgi:GMP synthase (glutamine-hydrolysing)
MSNAKTTPDRILLIVHQKTSVSGRIGELLAERGYILDQRCPCIGQELPESLDDHAGVVIFGGPMSANDDDKFDGLCIELGYIEKVLKAEVPLIGTCLGGQLLARTLGAKVTPHPEGRVEVGYTKVFPTPESGDLFAASEHFYQWHREGFDLPDGTTLLAMGDDAFPTQAFAYGPKAVGLQFHPEITLDMIQRWTTGGAHRMAAPGGQPKRAHLAGYKLFDADIRRWTLGLFDKLGLAERAELAEAAE